MTDRDWRIFREDFNIAYKGSNNVSPIRSWDEAGLPDNLLKVGSSMAGVPSELGLRGSKRIRFGSSNGPKGIGSLVGEPQRG